MSVERLIEIEEAKKEVLEYLGKVKRKGIKNLVKDLDKLGYFDAPASASNHLNFESGLILHSANVLKVALKLNESLEANITEESIIISALFHDLGKAKVFDKDEYVPNILKSGSISHTKPYERNKERPPIDHDVMSIAILQQYISLTEDEMVAILYHNGLYVPLGRSIIGKETKLYMIIHWADMWASRVIEKDEGINE
jgi:putative nucleotidyltransferase with HDIG domain